MKSAPGVQNLTPDAVAVATRFGELFIAGFCKEAYEHKLQEEKDPRTLIYKDLTSIVHGEGDKEGLDQYAFLQDIIPRKITVKEYWDIIAQQQNDPTVDHGSDNDDREAAPKAEDDDDEDENEDGADENGEAGDMEADEEEDSEDIEDEDEG